MKHITAETFNDVVLNANRPVVVDFWAEWCGPCKALAPVLDEVSTELSGSVDIVKLNVDEAREIAAKYGIRGIPTMIMFKNGEATSSLVGNQPKAEILKFAQS